MCMAITPALNKALKQVDTATADAGTVELARAYAASIDSATEPLSNLGPKLLACLDALLMTPKARAAVVKGGDDEEQPNPVDQLREKRRQRYAPAVDAAAT